MEPKPQLLTKVQEGTSEGFNILERATAYPHELPKPSVLIVDDRIDGLVALDAVLRSPEYTLVQAQSGMEALGCLLHQRFSLIILDVQMPGLDGFETARLIRQRDESRHIPIIFVTAINKDPGYVFQGYESGAVDYILKPFDPSVLRSKVAIFVELFKKAQQLEYHSEALRKAEAKNRFLIQSAQDIIMTCSPRFEILTVNPVFSVLTGWSEQEWQGKSFDDLLILADRDRLSDSFVRAAKGLKTVFEGRLRTAAPLKTIQVEASVMPLFGESETEGVLLMIRDVSERKIAEENERRRYELERSNRELEHFAYVCSHDLREPLRIVISYSQLLLKLYDQKIDARGREIIEFVIGGTRRMSQLIEGILEYSRVGGPTPELKPTQLQTVLDEVLQNLRSAIQESRANIQIDSPLPEIMGNHYQLVQLFQNLIGNSIKFRSQTAPYIQVLSEVSGSDLAVTIKDNGIGFPMQFSNQIFDVFKRLHTRDQYEGAGLGLSICKKIVERHSGKIWVESHPGQGTAFYFTLPGAALPFTGGIEAAPPPPQLMS